MQLTGNTCKQLSCEPLNMSARKGDKLIRFEKVEHALTVQVRDDADVVPKVEAVPQMDAFVSIAFVICSQCR